MHFFTDIPLNDSGSSSTAATADAGLRMEVKRLPHSQSQISMSLILFQTLHALHSSCFNFCFATESLAILIVYSMTTDSPVSDLHNPTSSIKRERNNSLEAHLTQHVQEQSTKAKPYLAGSKALHTFVHMISTMKHFFQPANSGEWTDRVRYLRYQTYNLMLNSLALVAVNQICFTSA